MARERLFSTVSTNIIGDPRPSALDLRVYMCVSLHDGMSLLKGTGRGCYATYATLSAEIGCDFANLSKSLKRLVGWGYLTEERQQDRRRKTYRAVFGSRESWRNRQQSARFAAREALQVDYRLGDDANLDELERALASGSPVARVHWGVWLKLNGRDDRAQRLHDLLEKTMTFSERDASHKQFLAEWTQRKANTDRRHGAPAE